MSNKKRISALIKYKYSNRNTWISYLKFMNCYKKTKRLVFSNKKSQKSKWPITLITKDYLDEIKSVSKYDFEREYLNYPVDIDNNNNPIKVTSIPKNIFN